MAATCTRSPTSPATGSPGTVGRWRSTAARASSSRPLDCPAYPGALEAAAAGRAPAAIPATATTWPATSTRRRRPSTRRCASTRRRRAGCWLPSRRTRRARWQAAGWWRVGSCRGGRAPSRAGVAAGCAGASGIVAAVVVRGKAPTRKVEQELWAQGHEVVVGIDEVGRGAWAGPLMVGAAILPRDTRVLGVRDSKMLTEDERERLFDRIAGWCYGLVGRRREPGGVRRARHDRSATPRVPAGDRRARRRSRRRRHRRQVELRVARACAASRCA